MKGSNNNNQNQKPNGNNEKKLPTRINRIDKNENNNNKIVPKRPLTSSTNTNSRQSNKINTNTNIQNKNTNIQKNIKNEKPLNQIQHKPENKIQPKPEQKNQINKANKINTNNNIKDQSNNNTGLNNINFLTELPAKMDLDNKAIKSIMPYFEKSMTYTKRSAKNEENVIILYEQKINELINIYIFTEKYLL